MSKRIKFVISFLLILVISVSALCVPVSSYENEVETSTADMLLINMDTETIVFSQKPDNMWYSGYLAELMTFYVAYKNIAEPEKVTFEVEQSFLDEVPNADGCLDQFVGKTLTAKDLMAVMLLSTGNDAAYALASLAYDGSLSTFVKAMNNEATALGCTKTAYVSPGLDETSDQVTTCRDLYRLYKELRKIELFTEIMQNRTYTPDGLLEGDYTVTPYASILNEKSPYYFRYTNDAKYSYTASTYANIAMTTTYRGKTYFYAGLLGLNQSERNVFADGRKLTTWAYLNMTDRKVLNADEVVAEGTVDAGWGDFKLPLYAESSAYKTLPLDFKDELLEYRVDVPDHISLPVFAGQVIGGSAVFYDGEQIDDVDLIADHNEGVGILSDFARFGVYAFDQVMLNEPPEEEEAASAAETEGE